MQVLVIRPYSWHFLVQSSDLVERSWEGFIRFSKVCFIGRLGPSMLFFMYEIGDGSKVQFWLDCWCGTSSLVDRYPELLLKCGRSNEVHQCSPSLGDSVL